jgi:protease I
MVIAPTMFRDEEYARPRDVLEGRGARVVTASTAPGECSGKLGMKAHAEISVADASKRDWDAAIFIGGAGSSVFFDDEHAHALAHGATAAGALLGAICIAPSTLAHAGLLSGVQATAFPSQQADLVAHGARWTGAPVTVDGRIITANGPEAAQVFGEAIAEALGL